jgi:hypothetical protein
MLEQSTSAFSVKKILQMNSSNVTYNSSLGSCYPLESEQPSSAADMHRLFLDYPEEANCVDGLSYPAWSTAPVDQHVQEPVFGLQLASQQAALPHLSAGKTYFLECL